MEVFKLTLFLVFFLKIVVVVKRLIVFDILSFRFFTTAILFKEPHSITLVMVEIEKYYEDKI